MCLEEKQFPKLIREWWKNIKVDSWIGHRLAIKLKILKHKIKECLNPTLLMWRRPKTILEDIQELDNKEKQNQLSYEERPRRSTLKEEFESKVREEEIKWRQWSRCKWFKDGDKNTRFLHCLESSRRIKRITSLTDGEVNWKVGRR